MSTPFNDLTGRPVVLPVPTGGDFARRRGFAASLDGPGTRTVGMIRREQAHTLDPAAPSTNT